MSHDKVHRGFPGDPIVTVRPLDRETPYLALPDRLLDIFSISSRNLGSSRVVGNLSLTLYVCLLIIDKAKAKEKTYT